MVWPSQIVLISRSAVAHGVDLLPPSRAEVTCIQHVLVLLQEASSVVGHRSGIVADEELILALGVGSEVVIVGQALPEGVHEGVVTPSWEAALAVQHCQHSQPLGRHGLNDINTSLIVNPLHL